MYGDTEKPISTKHHKNFDAFVKGISNGLTIMTPAKGIWVSDKEYIERIIPVKIMCTEKEIKTIVKFALKHYRQKAVMWYCVSNDVHITYPTDS